MAIDISKFNAGTAAQVRSNSTKQSSENEQSSQVAAKSTPLKGDSVVITAQAQQLQGAQTKMASLPEVDQKKVAEIKQAIAEGRYKIDPERLAANIASFEAELNELNKE
ncbi:MAG: flagellar biosynthesis anti-sigma factor FlgM [Shewanella sp.]|uniref:Negative regulator of flagellin synthesis n=1 Tax=Shewanella cutis TaxID=2766780 RepID=A0ABS9QSQ6_9GAMM|nr:flagellar biosynthesis anti-sigma factor FlgM [Shewanella sp. PS-2]MCG9962633.1 flagellar biosynthesis anti-sigma factor FlgM [Shewanella sp. PS-2]